MANNDLNDDFKGPRTYVELLKEILSPEFETHTTREQSKVEKNVLELCKVKKPLLSRNRHISYLKKSITNLSKNYEALDCSRPWICYWTLHSLELLGERLDDDLCSNVVQFLNKCQSPTGGFGGGPGQDAHLASTYAAVNALCVIGSREAYNIIDRQKTYEFLKSLRTDEGSFHMHVNGEMDIRGVYCALAVAKLLNIYTPELFKNTEKWVAKCQTWEGGFAGCPGMEAHGGYSFCGLASLVMLNKSNVFNLSAFIRWIVNKQMRLEGGFQGRTNKLVDGCYSFWQGGAFPLINSILAAESKTKNLEAYWMFDQKALQEYLLICCQDPFGGMLDKPGKNSDIYHTCYCLSGLSVAQNSPEKVVIEPSEVNAVDVTHPVYNIVFETAMKAIKYFSSLPLPEK
ncbi:hypothetical protein TKK_0017869 [Trichogramma kaykai]|uniref:Protein farnesyltransferase subunit beta n=1 Tax=Trichogramma kaykai TaxID=54128 RepID=A0ABD2W100_9HYME